MTSETPIKPQTESVLEFQGKEIAVVALEDPIQYIVVASFCQTFGIDVASERRRLGRKSWFEEYTRMVMVTTAGGPQASLCLRVDALPTFMLGINLEKISAEADRELFRTFMDQSSAILAEYWGLSEEGEVRFLREQMARMIAEHAADEAGMSERERIDYVEVEVRKLREDFEEKIEMMRKLYAAMREDYRSVTRVIRPGRQKLTEEMLGDVRDRVNYLAQLRIEHFREEKPYPMIWGYINRSIGGVSTYRDLGVDKYQEVVDWLDGEIAAIHKAFPPDEEK